MAISPSRALIKGGATPVVTVPPVNRPSFNTGIGFFTLSGAGPSYSGAINKIYDNKGNTFRPRGTNRTHYDSGTGVDQAVVNSNCNAERYALYWPNGVTSQQFVETYIKPTIIGENIVP